MHEYYFTTMIADCPDLAFRWLDSRFDFAELSEGGI